MTFALKWFRGTAGSEGLFTPLGAVWAPFLIILWESSCVLPFEWLAGLGKPFDVSIFMLMWFYSLSPVFSYVSISSGNSCFPSIISSGEIFLRILFYYSKIWMSPLY